VQVQCFVQEHVAQLLPPIVVAARQQRATYMQCQYHGYFQAVEYHRGLYQRYTLVHMKWLCHLAGQQALTKHAAAVLKLPWIPIEVTQLLQQEGLQLTTAQLVAAARGRVAGLENWVVQPYCLQLDPLVQAICCGPVVSQHGACLN
jgi:hypothetical protein